MATPGLGEEWRAGEPVRWRELPIGGGPRWRYCLGVALLVLLAVEAVTGVLLAIFYVPTELGAWASVFALTETVPLGAFLRALHQHGATVLLALGWIHLLVVFAGGAHRRPRELNWLAGVALLGLLFLVAATGEVLPWDQRAQAHASALVQGLPALGALLFDAPLIGEGTLLRAHTLHVLVLPALLLFVVATHLWVFRRQGYTGQVGARTLSAATPYWPAQARRDFLFSGVVLVGVVALAVLVGGAALGAPADLAAPLEAVRPAGYLRWFSALAQVLSPVGATALSAGALLWLAALPWLDRGRGAASKPSRLWGAVLFGLVAAMVAASGASLLADARDPVVQQGRALASEAAARARALARRGIPLDGPAAMLRRAQEASVREASGDGGGR